MTASPASPQIARAINDRLALDLLVEHGELSAPQLRELTGLSRPSVSDLLERLQESGLVRVVGESGESRRGPNAKVYGLVTTKAYVAGVDLRGGAIHVGLADVSGHTVAVARRTITDSQPLAALIRRAVCDAARKVDVDPSALHTVVVGAPGAIDQKTGELLPGYRFPGWDDKLLPELVDALDVPIVLENEVNLAGVVELHHGAGAGRQELAVLWLDRSVGASIIMGGRLRQGVSGGAGEVGKLALPGASLPRAGKATGGLHALVSDKAVLELAAAHGLPQGSVADVVRDACESDSEAAAAFVDELATRISFGALGLAAVVDPGLIVLAGDVGIAGDVTLAAKVAEHLHEMDATPTEVSPSTLTEDPIVGGAVLTALRIAHDDIFGGAEAAAWSELAESADAAAQ
ncbi:MAG: ROK family transcriptional regulator [Stackebrandtia sp.]